MSRMRGWLEAGLPWGILALMGSSLLTGVPGEGIERLVQQNGAVLLLVALLVQWAPRMIEAQREQAKALADLAAAVREQGRGQERTADAAREQGGGHDRALAELDHGQTVIMERLDTIKTMLGGKP